MAWADAGTSKSARPFRGREAETIRPCPPVMEDGILWHGINRTLRPTSSFASLRKETVILWVFFPCRAIPGKSNALLYCVVTYLLL